MIGDPVIWHAAMPAVGTIPKPPNTRSNLQSIPLWRAAGPVVWKDEVPYKQGSTILGRMHAFQSGARGYIVGRPLYERGSCP